MTEQTAPAVDWVDFLKDTFRFSYEESTTDINRLVSLQDTHDNKVADDMWPTRSKIPLPWAWAAVETATGPALEGLFPPSPTIRLTRRAGVDKELADKVQWALYLMLTERMAIKRECVRSVKDCFKVGVGYGIIEPITVTPPAVFEINAGRNSARVMGRGRPQRSLRYRYVSPGRVIVYPAGTDFNGNDPTPYSFFLDTMSEQHFRNMARDVKLDGDEDWRAFNVEAIITENRTRGFNSQTTIMDFVERMGGRKSYSRGHGRQYKNAPAMLPILKCYAHEEGRWTWIYAGQEWQIIYDKQDTHDTSRCPMVKFDCWTDADRWYGFSQPEGDERVIWEKNLLLNAINDLVTKNLNRPLLWDSTVQNDPPEFGPRGELGLPGPVDRTAKFMDAPGLDAQTFQMMQEIDNIHVGVTGQRDMTGRNYTRGGMQAFQELLNTSGGRDRLRLMLLKTGGFASIANQTLIYMQTVGVGMDLAFERPAYDQTSGKDYTDTFTVSEADLKHAFGVTVDFGEAERAGMVSVQDKLQLFNARKDSEYFDQWEVARDLCRDEYEAQRMVLPRDVVRQKQADKEAVARQAALAGTAEPAQAAPGGMAEAMAGGAALGGASEPAGMMAGAGAAY